MLAKDYTNHVKYGTADVSVAEMKVLVFFKDSDSS